MDKASQIGDFTIFGFTPDPAYLLQRRIPDRLGITPHRLDFGAHGSLFFHSTYGDIAETAEAVCIKLGFLRSLDKSTLSSEKLLLHRIIQPGFLDHDRVRGNALVVCLGKNVMSISAFKTLLGIPQLYYTQVDGGLICSDRLVCLVKVLNRIELNEEIIPMHFLFRSTPGEFTYYRQIHRLLPGGFFHWVDGELTLKIAQDFRFSDHLELSSREDENSPERLYNTLLSVVGDYVSQVEGPEESLATLLSGGVDSSLLQYLVNQQTSHLPSRSYSFAIRAPSFSNEIEYAQQASQLFRTEHTFVDIQPQDYPGLITRTIDALAQPPILETEPSMFSIAEFASANKLPERYFISGQGADTVFGLAWSKKLKGLHIASQVPGAVWFLRTAGKVLKPFGQVSQMLLKGGDIIACGENPESFIFPGNSIVMYVDLAILRRCFGDYNLLNALRYRRELASKYLATDHYLEKIHIIDLVTDTYELGVQRQQLFLAKQREKIHPFFDDEIIRLGFVIPPDTRYIKGFRAKYLLKDLLRQKTNSTAVYKPKGFSIWETDLLIWMKSGPLRPFVEEIKLPSFMAKSEFDRLLDKPDYFLWVLLNFDLFKKRCLN